MASSVLACVEFAAQAFLPLPTTNADGRSPCWCLYQSLASCRAMQHLVSWQQVFTHDCMPERMSSGMHRTRGASFSSASTARISSHTLHDLWHRLPSSADLTLFMSQSFHAPQEALRVCQSGCLHGFSRRYADCPSAAKGMSSLHSTPSSLNLPFAMSSPHCHLQLSSKYAAIPCQ